METKSVEYRIEGQSLVSVRAQNEALKLEKMDDFDLLLEDPIDDIEFTVVHMDDESNKLAW